MGNNAALVVHCVDPNANRRQLAGRAFGPRRALRPDFAALAGRAILAIGTINAIAAILAIGAIATRSTLLASLAPRPGLSSRPLLSALACRTGGACCAVLPVSPILPITQRSQPLIQPALCLRHRGNALAQLGQDRTMLGIAHRALAGGVALQALDHANNARRSRVSERVQLSLQGAHRIAGHNPRSLGLGHRHPLPALAPREPARLPQRAKAASSLTRNSAAQPAVAREAWRRDRPG